MVSTWEVLDKIRNDSVKLLVLCVSILIFPKSDSGTHSMMM